MDRSELSQTVRRAQTGDAAAFRELFYAYCGPLTRYAFRLAGNREEAEDVVQEAMIKAHRSLGRLRHPERFDAWIYRIVTNTVKDRVGQAGRQEISLDEEACASVSDVSREPDDETLYLRTLVDRLPHRLRKACVLFYADGFSCRETGAIIGTTERTVRVLLWQARQKLKGMVEETKRT